MKTASKTQKTGLLALAAVISLVGGVLTIGVGDGVYYFGFPSTFAELRLVSASFPVRLAVNPIQLAVNVGAIWLFLSCMSKIWGKLALAMKKKRGAA